MFFKKVEKLCKELGTTPTAVTLELGYSKGSMTYWKKGKCPSGDIVSKYAKRLGVTADYLLDVSDDPTPPGETNPESEIDEPIFIAMQRHYKKMPDVDRKKMDKIMKALFDEVFPEDDGNVQK